MPLRKPLFSIATPSLNQGRFISQAIESVRQQSYPHEHIVIDGGSTDETLSILRAQSDVKWISEPDSGQSNAINKGFAMAQGDVLAWLNADDLYLPGAFAAVAEVFEANPGAGLVFGDCDVIDEDGTFLYTDTTGRLDREVMRLQRTCVYQPAAFFTRKVFTEVGGLDESLHFFMDFDLWLNISGRFETEYLPRRLAVFRRHPASKTSGDLSPGLTQVREAFRVTKRHRAPFLNEHNRRFLRWYYVARREWIKARIRRLLRM